MKKLKNAYFISSCLLIGLTNVGYCGSIKEDATKKIETAAKKTEATVKKIEKNVSADKIKEKFHQAADSLSKEKVHESIDQVADYLDKDKLKEAVDAIADYFDKDKIKEFIDYVAEYLDRDKIKEMIDVVADAVDREKVKEAVDQVVGSIDKEQVKQAFDESVDQIAASLQEATHSLEQEISHLGNNKNRIQDVVKKYNWNKWLPDQASYGPATLSGLKLGGVKKAIVAKPGQKIEGEVVCSLDRKECSALSLYRVVLGIKNKGGQTTVFNHFGIRAGKETDHFTLTAPKEKGVYQVGFRVVEAAREGTAIQAFDDRNNENGWGEPVTIGVIIVV